ncbi:MAG: protein kinase, partial [Planctomycetota bacterium]|nr:protein kinase [Planctomycetota bacterium]
IHGLEESGGVRFLVLELVPGLTLAERIARGPLQVDEALIVCRQIAEALEAAHEKGIIHRDLKPGNVKVTPDGKVKVLDFGLAKAFEADAIGSDLSHSPTLTSPPTQAGVLLGTAAYMSPEQARGKPLDKRTDIWSFGCVLYECLTGKQAFGGETASDTISLILRGEPDWDRLPPVVTPGLQRLLRRCLMKDPHERLHHVADARLEIDDSSSDSGVGQAAEAGSAAAKSKKHWWLALAAAVAGFALGLAVVIDPEETITTGSLSPVRFGIDSPEDSGQVVLRNPIISPDGTTLVYSGLSGETERLYMRSLDELDSHAIAGTEGGTLPFLSPDGRWVGFFAGGKIKKVSIQGGQPMVVCDASSTSPGASWGPNGSIMFSTWTSGLHRVSADGGPIETVTTPDADGGEIGHWWPEFLPGGQKVLFTVWTTAGSLDAARIKVLDLATGRIDDVRAGASARYAPTGHLIYYWGGAYHAAPFSTSKLELTGEPVPILDAVRKHHPNGSGNRFLSFSRNGTLVYVPGRAFHPLASLHWVDHAGNSEPYPLEPQAFTNFSISPDDRRVAFTRIDEGRFNIWLHDRDRGTYERLTQQANNFLPVWHPDGKRLFFGSTRRGNFNVYMKDLSNQSPPVAIVDGREDEQPYSITPDGRTLVITEFSPESGDDIWLVDLESGGKKSSAVRTPQGDTHGAASPDGRWLAYVSLISDRSEVYVKPILEEGGEVKISRGGGRAPLWSPTANKLYYKAGLKIMAVPYSTVDDRFRVGEPTFLFSTGVHSSLTGHRGYDISRDGHRFLTMRVVAEDSSPDRINVVLNWFEELKRLVHTESD